jgi:hypothetical protein
MLDATFPFGFPWQTNLYLALYVFTLTVHIAFLSYVLAGTGYLAAVALGRAAPPVEPGEMCVDRVLRDWMPAMLSGAITAGVAPLLFVQILYKQNFYTANLLLFNRWMSILPVLIVGFYLVYLIRTEWFARRPASLRAILTMLSFLCFAFTAYSWTENHLLSVRTLAEWSTAYRSRAMLHFEPQLVPRLLTWVFGSVPVMALIVSWQLWYAQRRGRPVARELPALSRLSRFFLAGTVLAAAIYAILADAAARPAIWGLLGGPYLVATVAGTALQAWGWWTQRSAGRYDARRLLVCTAGAALAILGAVMVREAIRVSTLGGERLAALLPQHEAAAQVGGLWLFLTFFAINAALVGFCFLLVRRGRVAPAAPE